MVPNASEDEVFGAIDKLIGEEIVIGSADRYRLRHDTLREALLRTLSAEQRQGLELAVARSLADEDADPATYDLRIGWHLLRGGQPQRGADLLCMAGEHLFEATSFEDCIAPLEAALKVFSANGDQSSRVAEVSYMLVAAGFYVDRDVAVRHRELAMQVLGAHSGLTRAQRWTRFLGPRFAFIAALMVTSMLRWLPFGRARYGMPPVDALDQYLRVCVYSAGVAGFSFDTQTLRECVAALQPLRAINRMHVRNAIGLVDNLLNFNLGRLGTLMTKSQKVLANIRANERITEEERALSLGGSRFQRGLVATREGDASALEEIEELERLGPRIWALGALQLRTYFHMWRGESAEARRVWGDAELEFVRLGALWQLHSIHQSSAAVTWSFVGDALGLRRSIGSLEQQVEAGLCFSQHLCIARAEYETLAGHYEVARTALKEAFALLPDNEGLTRPWAMTAAAECSLAAGEFQRAEKEAQEARAYCAGEEYGQRTFEFRATRIAALAKSGQGHHDAAASMLDTLIERAEKTDNPFMIGDAHEARARVALADGDPGTARRHCEAVTRFFVPTRNPVLVARSERLTRHCGLGPKAELPDSGGGCIATEVFDTMQTSIGEVLSLLSGCPTATSRAQRALETLVQDAGAERGYLYLMRHGQLGLTAPTQGAEPPAEVQKALQQALVGMHADTDEATTLQHKRGNAWRAALLHAELDGQPIVVGAVVLLQGGQAVTIPRTALRDAIGQRLYDEGDVLPPTTETASVPTSNPAPS